MRLTQHIDIPEIKLDIMPLIDVIFQLLIFFMLSSSFVFQSGIKINLPKSEFNEPEKSKEIIVGITEDNKIFLNDAQTTIEGIKLKFESFASSSPSSVVVIKADTQVKHGMVVEIMGLAKSSGLQRLAIATAPPTAVE